MLNATEARTKCTHATLRTTDEDLKTRVARVSLNSSRSELLKSRGIFRDSLTNASRVPILSRKLAQQCERRNL